MNFLDKASWDVVTVETDYPSASSKVPVGLRNLIFSAGRFNWNINVLGGGMTWEGWKTKVQILHDYLSASDRELFLYVDSRDVLFVGDQETFMRRAERFLDEHRIVFCGDTCCRPEKALRTHYPYHNRKYRYLNVGGVFGYKKTFLDYTSAVIKSIEFDQTDFSDQLWWSTQYIKQTETFPIAVDMTCKIFQNLWDETGGRGANFDLAYTKDGIYNTLTNTTPLIVHAPGTGTVIGQALKVVRGEYCA
jgi:hypothetical protein